MLNLQEIDEAIADLESGKTSFTACARLADLYAVRDHIMEEMQKSEETPVYERGYSQAARTTARVNDAALGEYGDSEFMLAIVGKAPDAVWRVIDELMEALSTMQPRLYDSVMRRIDRID